MILLFETAKKIRQLLTEASIKSGVSDEYAFANVWNHAMSHRGMLKSKERALAEIEKAKKDRQHRLHFDKAAKEGFVAGMKTGKKDAYYDELARAAISVHKVGNHPSFAEHVNAGSRATVAGALIGKLRPSWLKHGAKNATSKADVILSGKAVAPHGISLKQGKTQLMSAHFNEYKATMDAATDEHMAIDKAFKAEHKKWVMAQVQKIGQLDEKFKKLSPKQKNTAIAEARGIMSSIHARHKKMTYFMANEAATGRRKFEEGSPNVARSIVTSGKNDSFVHDTRTNIEPITHFDPRVAFKSHGHKTGPHGERIPGEQSLSFRMDAVPEKPSDRLGKLAATVANDVKSKKKLKETLEDRGISVNFGNHEKKLLTEVVGTFDCEGIFLDDFSTDELMNELDEAQQSYDLKQHEEDSKQLTHLQHLEDLLVIGGEKGYHDVIDALQKTHDFLQGRGKKGLSIQTKFDGSPSIVWGHKDGKFFVGTKSFFNKTPKINFNDADIDANHGKSPALANKLKVIMPHLKKVSPKEGVFQGDLMYTGDEGSGDITNEGNNLSFTPNTLTYNIDKNSHEGRKIMNSKLGIAAHTHYEEDPETGDLKAVFSPIDMSKFKDDPDVHFLPTTLRGPHDYKAKDIKEFAAHLTKAQETQRKIDRKTGFGAIKGHERLLLAYLNDTVRHTTEPSTAGYVAFLHSQFKKNSEKLKSDAGKSRMSDVLNGEVKNVMGNKNNLDNIFAVHKHISNAKNVLTNVLGRSSPYKETILGSPSKPEGFVVTVNGNPIKFVDRQHFSAANFDWNQKANPDDNPTVMSWGRFNPPTTGHEKLINKGADVARRTGAKHEVVASRSQDSKKNPLTPTQKLSWLKSMFPGKPVAIAGQDTPTIIGQLQHYHNSGVRDLTMVVGGDRVKEFQNIIAKYNGPGEGKLFNFRRARVISAGARDPDAEGVEGMSASKMRDAAKKGDFKTFQTGMPKHIKPDEANQMFHDLQAQQGVQIGQQTSGHSLSIFAKRKDKIGQQAKQEIERRKRQGVWKGV